MARPNVLLICNDQEQHFDFYLRLVPEHRREEFRSRLRARQWLLQNGVSFDNHHGTSIPCTSARSVMWTGHHAPDTQLVDNMELPYQTSLGVYDRSAAGQGRLGPEYGLPTLGHMLQDLGYYPAYQGKVHLAQDVEMRSAEDMAERYGFFDWSGTVPGKSVQDTEGPNMGHLLDPVIAEKAQQWLRSKAPGLDQPWFLAVNFINPHDTMLVDIDGGRGRIQVMQNQNFPIVPPPRTAPYTHWWEPLPPANFAPDLGVQDRGLRPQLSDIWASICSITFGNIPFDASCQVPLENGGTMTAPMWQALINHYLNCIVDNDAQMWRVIETLLTEPKLAAARGQTLLLWTADHGEMMMSHGGVTSFYQEAKGGGDAQEAREVWMPLHQKGPFIYRENFKLPLVVASLSRELVPAPQSRTVALTSHTDLVPTMLAWAGQTKAWYEAAYGPYLHRLTPEVKTSLCGQDLSPIVQRPGQFETPQWNERQAVLFTYDTLNTQDPDAAYANAQGLPAPAVHFENRSCLRGFYDGRIKFARCFSAFNYAEQMSVRGDYACLTQIGEIAGQPYYGQDFVLFLTDEDPAEQHNRVAEAGTNGLPTLDQLNAQLNALLNAELADPTRTPLTLQASIDDQPWITRIDPATGVPGETQVTISGPRLWNRTEVYFNGVRAFRVVDNGDGSITATVPLGAVSGPVEVRTARGRHHSIAEFEVMTDDSRA